MGYSIVFLIFVLFLIPVIAHEEEFKEKEVVMNKDLTIQSITIASIISGIFIIIALFYKNPKNNWGL